MSSLIDASADAPATGAATSRLVLTSATALDENTGVRVPEAVTIADEVRVIIDRIKATLATQGLTYANVAKVTVWLAEEEYRYDFAYAYKEVLAPGPYPSRGLFTTGLVGDCRLQIDVIATRDI